jgi:hypothetical protein
MNQSFDLDAEVLSVSVAETINWCERQPIVAAIDESEEIKRRRNLGKQAGELIHRAIEKRSQFLNRLLRRNYTHSRLWRRGMELYRQADLDSIAPLSLQLRTPGLVPTKSLSDVQTESEREEVVRSVVMRRSRLLRSGTELAQGKSDYDLHGGRLLLYAPNENLADGAAKYASCGFFDVDNTPPWDVWVTYSHATLLSWVPPQLLTLAQSGIDANPECCICWMD